MLTLPLLSPSGRDATAPHAHAAAAVPSSTESCCRRHLQSEPPLNTALLSSPAAFHLCRRQDQSLATGENLCRRSPTHLTISVAGSLMFLCLRRRKNEENQMRRANRGEETKKKRRRNDAVNEKERIKSQGQDRQSTKRNMEKRKMGREMTKKPQAQYTKSKIERGIFGISGK
jgi:hypothetical protein